VTIIQELLNEKRRQEISGSLSTLVVDQGKIPEIWEALCPIYPDCYVSLYEFEKMVRANQVQIFGMPLRLAS
jgi:hypothetical protein